MRRVLRPLWILLALGFLLEAWLWDHLQPVVARIVGAIPWDRLKARLSAAIERLPPWATLIVFVVPMIVLFPIKVLGLWMLAHGHWLGAIGALVLAKLVGLGVAAFVFDVTRPKLLQMTWFRWTYERMIALRDWAHAQVAPIKRRLAKWLRIFRLGRRNRLLQRLWRIRRRMHRPQTAA